MGVDESHRLPRKITGWGAVLSPLFPGPRLPVRVVGRAPARADAFRQVLQVHQGLRLPVA
jgi:hypothetical protein